MELTRRSPAPLRRPRPLAVPPAVRALHRAAGTALLSASISASVALSVVSTAFNLYAMRRGVLVVGPDGGSLAQDLRRLPRLVAEFLLAPVPVRLTRQRR